MPRIAGQFELADPPSDAISSLAYYHGDDAPDSTRLLISSWDKHVYLYDTSAEYGERKGQLIRKFEHRAPVLAVCFGASENEAFTAGLDWQVKRFANPSFSIV